MRLAYYQCDRCKVHTDGLPEFELRVIVARPRGDSYAIDLCPRCHAELCEDFLALDENHPARKALDEREQRRTVPLASPGR